MNVGSQFIPFFLFIISIEKIFSGKMTIKLYLWRCIFAFLIIGNFAHSINISRHTLKDKDEESLFLYPIIMPSVIPLVNEVYLCSSVDVSSDGSVGNFWIRGFEPKVNHRTVHHMILAGCYENPISDKVPMNVWNCGGSGSNGAIDYSYPIGSVCNNKDGDQNSISNNVDTTLFLWSMKGSNLMLPPDAGFKFGKNSRIKYLVIQVWKSFSLIYFKYCRHIVM